MTNAPVPCLDIITYCAPVLVMRVPSPMNKLLPEIYEKDDLKKFNEKAEMFFPELSTDMTIKDYITGMLKTLPKSHGTKPLQPLSHM
jgi:hypothetical protein